METRFTKETGIEIKHLGTKHWQHVDNNDGLARQVGPVYATQAEALADHENYLVRGGWTTGPANRCKFCGAETEVDPSDQRAPADYCHAADHA